MDGDDLVSIVIPVWNRTSLLDRSVRSVLSQTDPCVEVVVVDNGSEDPEIVARIVESIGDGRVRRVRMERNLGPSGGRNVGTRTARGSLVGFLDSDDELEPGWLESMRRPFAEPDCLAVTCGFLVVLPDGTPEDTGMPRPMGPAFRDVTACFQAGTMLMRRSLFDAIGGYDEQLWYSENTELGLRIAAAASSAGAIVAIHEPLTRWHRDRTQRGYDRRRLDAVERLLDVHADALARDRRFLVANLDVAGTAAARLGEFRRSRGHFLRSMRARPSAATAARLGLTFVPPLARRVWRAP